MNKRTYKVVYRDGTSIVVKGEILLFSNTTTSALSPNYDAYLNSDDVRSIEDITGKE